MADVLMELEAEAKFDFLPPLKPASPDFPDYSTSDIYSDLTYSSDSDINMGEVQSETHSSHSDTARASSSMADSDMNTSSEPEASGESDASLSPRGFDLASILSSVDDKDEPRTWRWNNTAGKVVNKLPMVYERWERILKSNGQQELSSGTTTTHDDNLDQKCYHPFASKLDWEIAHWAVTEKISQKALDRLLKVPQVKSFKYFLVTCSTGSSH